MRALMLFRRTASLKSCFSRTESDSHVRTTFVRFRSQQYSSYFWHATRNRKLRWCDLSKDLVSATSGWQRKRIGTTSMISYRKTSSSVKRSSSKACANFFDHSIILQKMRRCHQWKLGSKTSLRQNGYGRDDIVHPSAPRKHSNPTARRGTRLQKRIHQNKT